VTDPFRDDLSQALGSGYSIQRELAGGGMSRVFVALEHALNRTVVVKVLKPDLAAEVNRDRFRREIMVVAQLHHPHVVPVLAAGEHRDLLWYTMPFVEGESLREALRNGRTMSPREVTRVLHDVVDALDYAHTRGVIHRDIKPGNILRHRMHSLVTDFGVAKALSAAMPHSGTTSAGIAIGTPSYMAPEQLAADPKADHRMDLYAVGLLAYELLTGVQPFAESSPQATMAAQLTRMPTPLATVRPDLSPQLSALIMRLLAKNPDERPASAAAALEELESFSTPPEVTPASGWTAAAVARGRRAPVLIAFAGAAVATAVMFGILHDASPDASAPASPARRDSIVTVRDTAQAQAPAPKTVGAPATPPRPSPAASASTSVSSAAASARPATTAKATTAVTKTVATPIPPAPLPRPPRPASGIVTPPRRFIPARRVAVIPARYGTARVDLSAAARTLSDSLRKAFVAAGYELASDGELVQLLAQQGSVLQRRAAQAAGIGAVVSAELAARGSEVRAQVVLLDVWRNGQLSAVESADLDKPLEALEVVRDATRALDRVSWRRAEDPRTVVVFDFDNSTGADSLAPLARRVADAVRATVARELNAVIVRDSAALATRDIMERREVAVRLRAGALVNGTLLRARNDSVTVRLAARDLTEDQSSETIELRVPIATAVEGLAPAIGRLMETLGKVNWGPKRSPED
jgi:hypothetical protein